MIATILTKNNKHICSNCRMEQQALRAYCWFCECSFSNYEEMVLQNYKEKEDLNYESDSWN